MKKIFLVFTFFLGLTCFSQQEKLNIGVNGGITIGNLKPVSSAAFGFDANYLFEVFEDLNIGPSLNFIYFLTEEVEGVKRDPYMYLPIGGAIRFQSIDDKFFVGADFGFAIGISPKGDNGGIFFKPMVGYNATDDLKVHLFYSGIKKRLPTYGYVGIGIAYDIFRSSSLYSY